MHRLIALGALLACTAPLAAQDTTTAAPADSAGALVARGDSLHEALAPAEALDAYEAALAVDPAHYVALWSAARSQVDVAKQLTGNGDSIVARRDSMYGIAQRYAERAVAVDSNRADGWFALGLALGQRSRTKGGAERLEFARRIYEACARGLAIDSAHSGLHHVIGAWHAEVRRLSGFTRFIARNILGADFLGKAKWDSAAAHLERAVELDSGYIFHRLELARIYVDMERWEPAREQLRRIAALPPTSDVMDPVYKKEAAALLEEIAGRGS